MQSQSLKRNKRKNEIEKKKRTGDEGKHWKRITEKQIQHPLIL